MQISSNLHSNVSRSTRINSSSVHTYIFRLFYLRVILQGFVTQNATHPINFLRPTYLAPPTRVQEAYNVYCMNDHANHVARRAYEKGWISRARMKKIFHRGLDDAFEDFRDGCLPPLYLNNMINYGKFYQYLSRT